MGNTLHRLIECGSMGLDTRAQGCPRLLPRVRELPLEEIFGQTTIMFRVTTVVTMTVKITATKSLGILAHMVWHVSEARTFDRAQLRVIGKI